MAISNIPNHTLFLKIPIVTLLLLSLISPLRSQETPQHVATTPVPQTEEADGWKERVKEFNQIPNKSDVKLVFLGDSITDRWRDGDSGKPIWDKYWAKQNAANLGIAGDRTEHVLWRLDNGNMDGMTPKLIVLLIGTNNTIQQKELKDYKCSAQQTADGIRAIIARLKTKSPSSKILLMGIFPCGDEPTNPDWTQNRETNEIIKKFADDKTVFYMDIGQKFLKPNGDLDIMCMSDMLHPTTKGYKIWAEAIKTKVAELLH